jgi:membrane-associated protease RseP (regulator of RpoE activity)
MRAIFLAFVVISLLASAAVAENKSSLFTGIVVKGARGAVGAEVVEVNPGSFSDDAGLRAGDIIVRLDGTKIYSLSGFVEGYKKVEGRDGVAMTVTRNGNNIDIEVSRYSGQAGSKPGMVSGAIESVEKTAVYAEETTHRAVGATKEAAGSASEYSKEKAGEAYEYVEPYSYYYDQGNDYAGEKTHKAVGATKEAAGERGR